MEVKLTSTSKIVEVIVDGREVPARIWEGHSANGVPVIAFVTRIAAKLGHDQTEFERDLQEHAMPSPDAQAWPLRMVL